MFSLKDFTLCPCMCILPPFSQEFIITWCFPFEDFHVVWESPYLEKLPVLRMCSFENMFILHWCSTFKILITLEGLPLNQEFSQAWEDISLRLQGIHADDISLGICPLQRCPHSLHAVLQFTMSSYFPSENPGRSVFTVVPLGIAWERV